MEDDDPDGAVMMVEAETASAAAPAAETADQIVAAHQMPVGQAWAIESVPDPAQGAAPTQPSPFSPLRKGRVPPPPEEPRDNYHIPGISFKAETDAMM